MDRKPKKLLYIILFSGELFLLFVAMIILIIKKQSIASILFLNTPSDIFILILIVFLAILMAISISLSVIKFPLFTDIKKIINEIINSFNLNTPDIFIISLLAGICEEVLFRGVLHPMIGIWLTSFIFILLHGYFNPLNWRISIFGLIMFCLSMLLGIIYIKYGLVTAIIFHTVYDFTAFFSFKKFSSNNF